MVEWISWAVKRPGPVEKQYNAPNAQQGIVCHSVEGWLTGAFGELDNPARQASWHLTNALDGTLYQSYPLSASCWASGSYIANTTYVAIESEGVAGTPLNAAQEATALRLFRELGFTARGSNLFQHNEVATRWSPNAGPTACPSHRYDGVFATLAGGTVEAQQQEDDMTPDEVLALAAGQFLDLLKQAIGVDDSTFSDTASVAEIRAFLAKTGIPEHSHKSTVTTVTLGGVVK